MFGTAVPSSLPFVFYGFANGRAKVSMGDHGCVEPGEISCFVRCSVCHLIAPDTNVAGDLAESDLFIDLFNFNKITLDLLYYGMGRVEILDSHDG